MTYLVHDIFERVRAVNGEANEEKIGLWVGEWSQTVVFFLACSVPERQFHRLTTRLVIGVSNIVFEDCRDIFLLSISNANR